jgi:hypothetical protein
MQHSCLATACSVLWVMCAQQAQQQQQQQQLAPAHERQQFLRVPGVARRVVQQHVQRAPAARQTSTKGRQCRSCNWGFSHKQAHSDSRCMRAVGQSRRKGRDTPAWRGDKVYRPSDLYRLTWGSTPGPGTWPPRADTALCTQGRPAAATSALPQENRPLNTEHLVNVHPQSRSRESTSTLPASRWYAPAPPQTQGLPSRPASTTCVLKL